METESGIEPPLTDFADQRLTVLATRSNLVRASGLQPERDFSQTGLSRPCLAIPTIPACPLNGRNLKLVVKKEQAFARVVPKNFTNSFATVLFICLDQLNTDYHYSRNLSRTIFDQAYKYFAHL
jgi:hypothetical protein